MGTDMMQTDRAEPFQPTGLSEDAEDLAARLERKEFPDVLVIGSGYGAAVAALRLAEAGRQVWLIERGREYAAGDFPAGIEDMGRHLRFERESKGVGMATGYEDALFDLRLGRRFSSLVGNGLGGGSLINAGVMLRPPDAVFDLPEWPQGIRANSRSLDGFFQQAYAALGTQVGTAAASGGQATGFALGSTDKFARLGQFAEACRKRLDPAKVEVSAAEEVPVTVALRADPVNGAQACIGCGNCMSGCRHNAKLSLDRTYLRKAQRHGARLFTRVSALWVERPSCGTESAPGTGPGGWRVHCVRTAERGLWSAAGGRAGRHGRPNPYEFCIDVPQVVVAAGVVGTLEILQRSRNAGLAVSGWLGRGISANGDEVAAAYRMKQPAGAVGWTQEPTPEAGSHPRAVGPTICGVVSFEPCGGRPVTDRTIVQDGTAPAPMQMLLREMLQTLAWRKVNEGGDPAGIPDDTLTHSLFLLGMGHDKAEGRFTLQPTAERDHERGQLAWDDAADLVPAGPLHASRMSLAKKGPMKAREFLSGFAAGALPAGLSAIGGPGARGWLSVHLLGGCRMGDSRHEGVVDHLCRVFDAGHPAKQDALHPGLYVMDGAIVPRSLGVNPALTITALVERAMAGLLQTPAVSPPPQPNSSATPAPAGGATP
jgi:choline dehydrogenase-like flavoprotein